MCPEMTHRQLLEAGSTLQTRHRLFRNAFPPVAWCGWCLRCLNSTTAMGCFLGVQCEKAAIGVLEGGMHVLWRQSVDLNLCEHDAPDGPGRVANRRSAIIDGDFGAIP